MTAGSGSPTAREGSNATLALSRLQITISDGRGQWLPDARTRRRVPSMTGDYLTHVELLEQRRAALDRWCSTAERYAEAMEARAAIKVV